MAFQADPRRYGTTTSLIPHILFLLLLFLEWALIDGREQLRQLIQSFRWLGDVYDASELLPLLVVLEDLQLGAVVADALEDLFHVLHESIVENWLVEFDVPEVPLTLPGLPAGFALLIESGNAESEVVGT